MKKWHFYGIAGIVLLVLAFASCNAPLSVAVKSANLSIKLNLPRDLKSNVPEAMLGELGRTLARSGSGSDKPTPRLIHPDSNWLELEVKDKDKDTILYSFSRELTKVEEQLEFEPIAVPVKTELLLSARVYNSAFPGILLGSSESSLYLSSTNASQKLLGIKPVTAISGGVTDWLDNAKSINFDVSEYSDDFFILEFPIDFGDGLYKIELDPAPTGNFDSVVLYTADGIRHKGAILGDELGITPELGQSPEKELYFGLKRTENKCYVLLQASENFIASNIYIILTKLEEELLVVGQDDWDYSPKYILQKSELGPPEIYFGQVTNGTNYLLDFSIYNPYNQALPLSISLKDKGTGAPYQSDRFSIDISENRDAILPGKVLGLDAYLHFITGGAEPEDEPKCVISSPGFADFAMIFTGSQSN